MHKNKSGWMKILIIMVIGVVINVLGRTVATKLSLPFWLDSAGTGITACMLGPVFGAVSGALNNIILGLSNPMSLAYGVTNVVVGIAVGVAFGKGVFDNIFKTMSLSVIIALLAAVISTPFNLVLYGGYVGNVWGDALFSMLRSYGWVTVVASALGELFIDFPDKVIMVLITYGVIRLTFVKKWTKTASIILIIVVTAQSLGLGYTEVWAMEQSNPYDSYYTQTIYNNDNGLTAGEANAIVQTEDGYIWIGTYAGLYRYDGRKFTIMNFDSVKNVNRLYVDSKGRLWIGTNDKGVSVYDNGEITSVIDKNSGLASNSVRCIGEDKKGNYYIGTSASMCVLSDNEDGSIGMTDELSGILYANNISKNSNDEIAVVTNAGEVVFIKDKKIIGTFKSPVGGCDYTAGMYSEDGTLYLATSSNKVYMWNFDTNTIELDTVINTGSLSYMHSLYEDDNGQIWICSDTGIGYISANKFVKVETEAFGSSVDNMIKDYQGNLWFTSSRLGVLKLTQNSFEDIYNQCGLTNKVVNSVVKWNGLLYSGTDSGLDIIDSTSNRAVYSELTNMLDGNRIRCLFVDSLNNLWISTSSGIGLVQVAVDGTIKTYTKENGTVGERFRSTIELNDGTIVAAENTGIDFIKDGMVVKTLTENDGLTNPQILSMIQKDNDTFYAGSDGNGIMVIKNQQVVDRITEADGLPSGVILRIVKAKDGYVIVTSNSLCYMDADEKITELKEFPYSNNYDVANAGNGKVWVLGSAGIYIVDENDLIEGKELSYELLDSRKGLKTSLTANAWNYTDSGRLYFCGNTGIYSINMDNYMVYTGNYCMMAECVVMNDNNLILSEETATEIPCDTTRLTIRPELLNYTLNDPYIRYYLEGVDKKEYFVQQSALEDIAYTNIGAGVYTFHISVLDNTGNNVLESRSYVINKLPQFWEHTWFYAYLIFVCILMVAYITWMISVVHTNKIIDEQKREITNARKQAQMGNETILTIAKTVDARDENTSKHSERVAEYSVMIAKKIGWTDSQCENLRKIALLHDIGKSEFLIRF